MEGCSIARRHTHTQGSCSSGTLNKFQSFLRNKHQPVDQEDNDDDNKEVEKLTEEEEEGVLGVLVVKVHLDRSVSAEKHCYIGQIK